MNKTVGSLKADFKQGADPGRAYIDAKLGPAASMTGIADNAKSAVPQIGAQLGSIYKAGDTSGVRFPVQEVQSQIADPIDTLRAQQEGEGGTGASPLLDEYQARLQPQPNPAKVGAQGYTPSGLFSLKRNIAANTRWNDPTQLDLNAVRQENVGSLGGMLTDQFPEAKPLNSQYQGLLRIGNRASERAATGSKPLSGLFSKAAVTGVGAALGATHGPLGALGGAILSRALESVPVRTTIATGLGSAGRGAVAIGGKLKSLYGAPTASSALLPPRRQIP